MISTNIRITTKKISAKKGIVKAECLECPIKQVTGVKINQGLFGKIFNYGTLVITTASNTFEFDYIPEAEKVKDIILQNIK